MLHLKSAAHQKKYSIRTLVFIGVCFSLVATPAPLFASTEISTSVCNIGSDPQLVVIQPESDSTITTPNFIIKGTAANTTHIESAIDGIYDQTVSIEAGSDSFAFSSTILEGSHKIKVSAQGPCGDTPASVEMIVRRLPPALAGAPDSGPPATTIVSGVLINPVVQSKSDDASDEGASKLIPLPAAGQYRESKQSQNSVIAILQGLQFIAGAATVIGASWVSVLANRIHLSTYNTPQVFTVIGVVIAVAAIVVR